MSLTKLAVKKPFVNPSNSAELTILVFNASRQILIFLLEFKHSETLSGVSDCLKKEKQNVLNKN